MTSVSYKNIDIISKTEFNKNKKDICMIIKRVQKLIDIIRGKSNKVKTVKNFGKNNHFFVINENGTKYTPPYIDGLHVEFYGDNSIITIKEPFKFNNVFLRCGSNNVINIDKNFRVDEELNIKYPMREGAKLIIGKDFSCVSAKFFLHDEPNLTVKIGDDCMFSFNIIVWPSDGHSILNNENQAINKGEDITINDHVWVGMDTKILKGSTIPKNSILGAGTVFTKAKNNVCSGGVVFAGCPAKIIKEGISWDRRNYFDYKTNESKS